MSLSTPQLVIQTDRVETICFVGDSQARVLDGLPFDDPSRPGTTVLPVLRRTHFFRANRFFDGERFDARMTHVFWELKCVLPTREETGDAIFTPLVYPIWANVTERRGMRRNPAAPPIVISCGGVDVWDIEHELFPRYTVELDHMPAAFDGLPSYDAPERIDQSTIFAMIEQRCAPVFAGIAALRRSGFENLFVFGMPAPMMEEREHWKPIRLRYLMRTAFNRVYAQCARSAGATFVDLWEPLAKDGLRDDRYFADPEHMNEVGGAIILNQIYAKLRG